MTSENPAKLALSALLLVVMVAALSLVCSPVARASDTFHFDNETEMPFTPNNQDDFEEECWYGATGVFRPGPTASQDGSITADAGFGCQHEWWGSNLAFNQTYGGSWEQEGVAIYYWYGGTGAFNFGATDPFIGDSSVSCAATGPEFSEGNGMTPIESYMTSEADGDTCTVSWLPGVSASDLAFISASPKPRGGHVRMIDSLARVHGGKAYVRVQVFGLGHNRYDNEVVLRTTSSKVIGRASRELRVGEKARTIPVPLSGPIAALLAKDGELRVRAAVHIDSAGGTGDTTSQLLLRDLAQ